MRSTAWRIAFMVVVTVAVTMFVFVGICVIGITHGGENAAGWGVGLGLGIAGLILAAIAWLLRYRRARRARDAPAEPRRVLPMLGVSNAVRSPYLVLVASGHPMPDEPGFRYERGIAELERFMWDPAIETLGRGDVVLLHRHRRTGVVDLPDGTRLWPAGPLRVKRPRGYRLVERPSVQRVWYRKLRERARGGDAAALAELTDLLADNMREAGTDDPLDPRFEPVPEQAAVRFPLGYTLMVDVAAGIGSYLRFSPAAALAVVVYTTGFAVYTWAWYGASPRSS